MRHNLIASAVLGKREEWEGWKGRGRKGKDGRERGVGWEWDGEGRGMGGIEWKGEEWEE